MIRSDAAGSEDLIMCSAREFGYCVDASMFAIWVNQYGIRASYLTFNVSDLITM
jgi:hypothetical protein